MPYKKSLHRQDNSLTFRPKVRELPGVVLRPVMENINNYRRSLTNFEQQRGD